MEHSHTEEYLIHISKDGRVTVNGGIWFFPGRMIYVEEQDEDTPHHTLKDMYVFSVIPKWWQLTEWWDIIQRIRKVMEEK